MAGKILYLDYDDRGNLYLKALVEDSEARRMGGISIAATVIESEVCDEDSPVGFHFVITKAIVDEISLKSGSDQPSPSLHDIRRCVRMTGIIFGRKGANLRTISPIDDEKDQSFQESFKRLRSLLIGQRARFACLETIV